MESVLRFIEEARNNTTEAARQQKQGGGAAGGCARCAGLRPPVTLSREDGEGSQDDDLRGGDPSLRSGWRV